MVEGLISSHRVFIVGIWAVIKIMVPVWVPNIVRHLISRVPKKGP